MARRRLGSPRFLAVQGVVGLSLLGLGLTAFVLDTTLVLLRHGITAEEIAGLILTWTVPGAAAFACAHAVIVLASQGTVDEGKVRFRNVAVRREVVLDPTVVVSVVRRRLCLGHVVALTLSDQRQYRILATASIVGGEGRVAREADVVRDSQPR